ncbi:MAG: glycosyltransferase [Flavobacteriaceae bacterium]|nr:glycosyltransferase [Flavobacteriaceae bacterium]
MVFFYLLIAVVIINSLYYLLFLRFLTSPVTTPQSKGNLPSVSVLICAKNEADNLRNNIPSFLAQDHSDFELILINDASTDDTLEVIEEFAEQDLRVKIVNVRNNEAFWASKKYALTLGIKKAQHKHLIFSDADCIPASTKWLSSMAAHFTEKKQLVLGYGAYNKRSGFLNKLIRYETLLTAIQYFSYAKAQSPYMGVGRNLGYTTDLYYSINGFISHIKLPSGDDDLFVNEAGTGANTALSIDEEAFTYSEPKHTWSQWLRQKRRHITTASHYRPLHKILLATFFTTNVLFYLLIPFALFFSMWKWILPLILFRIALQAWVVSKAASIFKEKDLRYLFPVYELFLLFVQMSIFISNRGPKQPKWK